MKKYARKCPNSKCNEVILLGDLKSNRVKCPKCKYGDFCFSCLDPWIKSGFGLCGNEGC
jgi:hypothetical protein